jgi:HlyD family secretion protein
MKRRLPLILLVAAVLIGSVIYAWLHRPQDLILTGMVTTDEIIVSPQIQGRLQHVWVREGDTLTNGQLIADIQPETQQADLTYYASSELQAQDQVAQAGADLRFEEAQTTNQISQAEANLAAAQAQLRQASADLDNAQLAYQRQETLKLSGTESAQAYDQARTTFDAAQARSESARQQVQAAAAAVALAQSNAEQVAARAAALAASQHQLAATGAQKEKARVQLGYTEIRAPMPAVVDTRVALTGEVVSPGQAIVTLINQDDLWVRADVEERYVERIHLGDRLPVKLPSGNLREGTVFYRRVDADYATQRDVSRSKRDIKTFEIRLRCHNDDRTLAVGMTAYVVLPANHP